MEQIKEILKELFAVGIMTGCVLVVIGVLFGTGQGANQGVFVFAGEVFETLVKDTGLKIESLAHLGTQSEDKVDLIYQGKIYSIGDAIKWKDMFSVVNEEGFTLSIEDVCTEAGKSVLTRLSTEEILALEEIPSAAVYDIQTDTLYMYVSGSYILSVNFMGSNGSWEQYECKLLVEAE